MEFLYIIKIQIENNKNKNFFIIYKKVLKKCKHYKKIIIKTITFINESLPKILKWILNLKVELSLNTILQYISTL